MHERVVSGDETYFGDAQLELSLPMLEFRSVSKLQVHEGAFLNCYRNTKTQF